MKKISILTTMLVILLLPMIVQASTYTFQPYDGNDNDVFDFDHNNLYIWGIKTSTPIPPANEVITSAAITITNLNNWDNLDNILKFYLVDNPRINDTTGTTVDIISIGDSQSQAPNKEIPFYETSDLCLPNQSCNSGKKFTDYRQLNITYTDTNGTGTVDQFAYSFSDSEIAVLTTYLGTANPFLKKTYSTSYMDTNFGLGFDPDCHYYNSGVTLTIETSPVPEPTSLLLLGFGLMGLAGVTRKFKR